MQGGPTVLLQHCAADGVDRSQPPARRLGVSDDGARREPMPGGDPVLGTDAAMVALPSLFDAGRAGDLDATYELDLDGDEFVAGVAGGRLTLERGRAPAADAVIATDPGTLAQILWHERPLRDAIAAGDPDAAKKAAIELLEPATTAMLAAINSLEEHP